jgi:hypothetical protein
VRTLAEDSHDFLEIDELLEEAEEQTTQSSFARRSLVFSGN